MKEILSKLNIDITELARRFEISRPTVYKYIRQYADGNASSIPENIRSFFDFISADSNQNPDDARRFLMNSFPSAAESGICETDQALESIIMKFCDEKQTKDNFLSLVLPTGSRKTTSVVHFIADYIAGGGKRRIFFVTTLKKNLPVNIEEPTEDALRRSFEEYGIGDLYNEKVLVVDSLADTLLNNFPPLSLPDKRHCQSIMGGELYGELNDRINTLRDIKNSNMPRKVYDELFAEFRIFENKFRRSLEKKLADYSKSPTERTRLVTSESDWIWVSKIYPSVYTDNRQVFLMSMAKFVSHHDTVVNGRYPVYDSDLLNDAYVFIDEFDATKETVMERIIESDKGEVDYIGIFRRIFRTLQHDQDIWRKYYKAPENGSEVRKTVSEKDIQEIKEATEALAKDYHLECDFKLYDSDTPTYIFRDNKMTSIGGGREYVIEYREDERINYVRCRSSDAVPNGKTTISRMLNRMYGLFRRFEAIVYILALNHMSIQESEGKPIALDSAIRTMLDPYDFDGLQKKYLVDAIKYRPPKRVEGKDPTPDTSFYETGFEFYNFMDAEDHNLSTKVYCTSIKRTPEKMLIRTLDRTRGAKVIGISATARLRTVVGNYDFRYLKSQEDFSEYMIDPQDRARLKEMFGKTIDCYDRVNIVTKLIDGNNGTMELFSDDGYASQLDVYLNDCDGGQDYIKKRYLRVFNVFREFVEAEDARSMICFLNLFPREDTDKNEGIFSADLLRKVFVQIIKEKCDAITTEGRVVPDHLRKMLEEPFIVLKSNRFDKNKENLLNRLSKGEKIFVMTTYATVGAGQNLQYKIPSDIQHSIRFISTLADPSRAERKDFDCIYVDMPTNVAKNVKENNRAELLGSLFDIESLQENHELDSRGAKTEVAARFSQYYGHKAARRHKTMEFSSYRMAYARKIIQAVGRICRTFVKNQNIYVFADDALGEVFKGRSIRDYADPNDRDSGMEDVMANPEFKLLLKEMQNSTSSPGPEELRAMQDNESLNAKQYIDARIENRMWSKKTMEEWGCIREYVLTFPTLPADSKLHMAYDMYHCFDKLGNRLRYYEEGDYREVYIDPNGDHEVSESDARLADFLKIPCVKPLFGEPVFVDYDSMPSKEELEALHYADRFMENGSIMCPVLYHNIYKGALGEVSGKAILEDWGIEMFNIDDPAKFERFDFISGNGTYIDFKHWAGSGSIDNAKMMAKMFRKLKEIGGKKAIIINVLKPIDFSGSDLWYTKDGDATSYTDVDGEPIDYTGLSVTTVPYLYDCDGDVAIPNLQVKQKIVKEAM